jgi:hypothetical protein
MAFGRGGQGRRLEGLKADVDLSSYQWHFVKMADTSSAHDYTVMNCDGSTDKPIGILQNKPNAAGKPAEVLSFGSISKLKIEDTINCGAVVSCNANGHGITLTGTDTPVMGIALTYGVTGDVISVLLCGGGITQAT